MINYRQKAYVSKAALACQEIRLSKENIAEYVSTTRLYCESAHFSQRGLRNAEDICFM